MKLRRCLAVLPVMLFCFSTLAPMSAAVLDVPVDLSTAFSATDVTARHVVRLRVSQNGSAKNLSGDSYFVPTGKRLVLNHATFRISGPTGFQPLLQIETFDFQGNSVFLISVEPHKVPYSPAGSDVYIATMTAPLYVDAGQTIFLSVLDSFTGTGGPAGATGLLQGYLVECGPGCTQE